MNRRSKYKNFRLEDFLADEDFRLWVLKEDSRLDFFWKKWMTLHPEKKKTVLKARELILSFRFRQSTLNTDEREQTLDRILKGEWSRRFVREKPAPGFNRLDGKGNWGLRAAAAVALIVSVAIILTTVNRSAETVQSVQASPEVVKENPKGQKLTFKLPDGTTVVLNAESKLSFPQRFSEDSRKVFLQGEAYFEVVKDENRPFSVSTGNISTNVLGTAFNVKAFPDNKEIAISLLEGSVKVTSEDGHGDATTTVLTPGEKVSIDPAGLNHVKSKLDPLEDIAWKDGVLYFNGDDFSSVKEKIERWYGVDIVTMNAPGNMEIKGKFKNLSLEAVLDNLRFTNKIEYSINEKVVSIKFKD